MAVAGGMMLGAELEGLSSLSTQIVRTSEGIGASRQSASAVADQVVGELEATFLAALGRINQTTTDLTTTVNSAKHQMDATAWTGANADQFNGAVGEFSQQMAGVATATDEAYNGFRLAMDEVRAHILEHQEVLRGNLVAAEEATRSMAQAVDTQYTVLDTAMNSGAGLA